jgi:hypothetical protein
MAKKNEVSGWVGWVGFASLMMMLAGVFHIIAGFVALFQEDVYVAAPNALWVFDYSQWGWIHMLGGALALIAAGSLMQGKLFGRTLTVLVAMFSAIANMAFVPVYPVWSLMIITIDLLVIWAVTVHGGEMKELE